MSTEKLLEERQSTHGEYTDHARVTQGLMRVMQAEGTWNGLPDIIKESLHMFAHKVGRVMTGNPYVKDHWDDIAGYSVLISQRVEDKKGLKAGHDDSVSGVDAYSAIAQQMGVTRPVAKDAVLAAAYGRPLPAAQPRIAPAPERPQYVEAPDVLGVTGKPDGTVSVPLHYAADTPPAPERPGAPGPVEGEQGPRVGHTTLEGVAVAPAPQKPQPVTESILEPIGPGTPEDGGHHAMQEERPAAYLNLEDSDVGKLFRTRGGQEVELRFRPDYLKPSDNWPFIGSNSVPYSRRGRVNWSAFTPANSHLDLVERVSRPEVK